MTAARTRHSTLVLAAVLILLAACATVRADEAGLPHYVRAYVPADGVEDWPRGRSPLEPISAREFEELAEFMEPHRGVPDAQIDSAEFTAELSADDLLSGTADLTISTRSPQSVFMPFGPCTLAVSDANWHDADSQPALLGVDVRGKQRLRVDQPGRLSFAWSLRGRRNSTGQIEFAAQLPPALSNRVVLTLPQDRAPDVPAAIITSLDGASPGTSRWQIDLGRSNRFRMRVLKLDDTGSWQPLSLLRQTATYDFSPRGMDLVAELKLDVPHDPLKQLTVAVDSPLEITEASLGDAPVEFSQSPADDGVRRVTFYFAQPIKGFDRTLRLEALAPLTTDGQWKLPRILPQGPYWMGGTATLVVRKPLTLADLSVTRGRQTRVAAINDPASEPEFELQLFAADAEIKVVLQRSASKLNVAAATMIELTDGEINGRMIADVATAGADRFVIGATLSPGWELVDEIDSIPPAAVEMEPTDDPRRFMILVKRGIAPGRPLRLRINARNTTLPADKKVDQAMFRMASFDDVSEFRNLIHLRARGSQQIEAEGVERLDLLKLNELPPGDAGRVEGGEPLLMWLDRPGQNSLRVSVREQSPHFTTQNSVDVRVTKDIVQRRYQILCSPQASVIENVLVSFSGKDSPPKRWRVTTHPEVRVTAEKWIPENDGSTQPIGAAAWNLSLSQPLSQEFELASDQTLPLGNGFLVNVFAVDGAEQQTGNVAIFCEDDSALVMENRGLKPIPSPPVPADQNNTLRGEFQFKPRDDVRAGRGVVVSVQRDHGLPVARKPFAWSATVESMIGSDGVTAHRATLFIENNGTRRLAVQVPGDKTPVVYVDGDPAAIVAESGGPQQYVELPVGERFCTLTIDYETEFAPSAWTVVRRISQPRPALDIPVLAWHGVVHTSPGFVGVNSLDAPLDGGLLSWREQLFGPLARRPREAVFDPFDRRTWRLARPGGDPDRGSTRQTAPPSLHITDDAIASSPWRAAERFVDSAASERGWTTTVHDFDGGSSDQLLLVHVTALKTLQWTIFLAVFAGVCWRPPRRFAVRVVALAVLGLSALFAPAVVAGTFTSALLGFALALVACWTMTAVASLLAAGRQKATDAAAESHVKPLAAPLPEALAVFMAIVVCWPAASTAQPPAPQSPIYRVFIPYDGDPLKPVGDTYYITSEFDQALQRVRALRREQQPGWLIRRADYQGDLVWEPGRARLVVERLRAVYDLEVSTGNADVRIPFDREQVTTLDGSVSLDGSIIEPVWNVGGTELSLPISDVGAYRLEIELRANAEFIGPTSRLEFNIPALCTSRLELNLPDDAQRVEVPSAAGRVVRDNTRHQLVADLGATGRLTVSWPNGAAPEQSLLPVDVRQLTLVKIRPAAVTLDAQLKLIADRVRSITLEADPRLRLLSYSLDADDPNQDPHITRVTVTNGDPQNIALEFNKTIYGEHEIKLSFFVADTTGVGAVLIPRFNVADVKSLRQFVAVSVDPSLQINTEQVTPDDDVTQVSIDELGGPWNLPGLRTAQIYELARPDAEFTLPTTLRSPATQGTEQLAFRRENGDVVISYEADLETRGGYVFQHRATVPSDFTVNKVAIRAEGESRVLAAFQHGKDQLTVFLAAPLTGPHVLTIDGRLAKTGDTEAPGEIKLHDCNITESTVMPLQPANVLDEDVPQQSSHVADSAEKVEAQPLDHRQGEPKVLLADIYIDWHQDGRFGGFAAIDVEPAGTQTVRLALPDNGRLVAARVAGLTAAAKRVGADQWDLPLSSGELTQRIEVVYQGRWTKTGRGRRQFQSPVLRSGEQDMSVARTLWTVTAPAAAGQALSVAPSARQVTLPEQQLARLGETARKLSDSRSDLSLLRNFPGGPAPPSGAITRVAKNGPCAWLEVAYLPRVGNDGWQRIIVALIILAGTVALLFAKRHAALSKTNVWLPPLACFLVGVCGWLLLWPGFLGLTLVAVSLVLALRLGWAG